MTTEKLGGLRLGKPARCGYIKRCTVYETTTGAPKQAWDVEMEEAFNELFMNDKPLSPRSDFDGSDSLFNPLAFPKSNTAYDKGKPIPVAVYDPSADGPPKGRQQVKAVQKTVFSRYQTKDGLRLSIEDHRRLRLDEAQRGQRHVSREPRPIGRGRSAEQSRPLGHRLRTR